MRKFLILACLTAPAAPVLAGTWTAPAGCDAFMTVQSKSCRVSHYYRCSADAPGDQWRVDMDQEGAFFFSRIDREGQWVESFDPVRQMLDPGAADGQMGRDRPLGRIGPCQAGFPARMTRD